MNIYKYSESLWIMEINGRFVRGTRKECLQHAKHLGYRSEELIYALETMLKNSHNCMVFGVINKTFIFSKDEDLDLIFPVAGAA